MILFLGISFLASVVGALCGIGGGILMKPIIDFMNITSIETTNFLCGCSVLFMSFYSLIKEKITKKNTGYLRIITPLAMGAALGGVLGQQGFSLICNSFSNRNAIGGIQAMCLFVVTLLTFLYLVNKRQIKTKRIQNRFIQTLIGSGLGGLSAFLGIGGGPINLVVLNYFFSLETKSSVTCSLYIIFMGQFSSLIAAIVANTIPPFDKTSLLLMIIGGIGGGVFGRMLDKKLNSEKVDLLFGVIIFIILILCIYNIIQYFWT